MKHLLYLVTLLALSSCGRFIPAEVENGKLLGVMPMQYGKVYYQSKYTINASREDIFRQVRKWAAFHSTTTIATYPVPVRVNTPTTAFNISDNLIGDVLSNGSLDPVSSEYRTVTYWPGGSYTTSIECYEGYYRMTITNIRTYGIPTPHAVELRDQATPIAKTKAYYQALDKQIAQLFREINGYVQGEIADLSQSR